MFRPFLLLLVALMFAPAAFAQNNDYSHYEFYVGYAYERADNNAATFDRNGKTRFNGNTVLIEDKRENYNDRLTYQTKAVTALAMAVSGVLDVHASEHIDVRVIQDDYVPTFFNSTRQDNILATAGIKIK